MNTRRVTTAIVLSVLVTIPCQATPSVTITETFDGTIDQASWRMGASDEIAPSGGHPDSYLRVPQVDTAEPRISTVPGLADRRSSCGFETASENRSYVTLAPPRRRSPPNLVLAPVPGNS